MTNSFIFSPYFMSATLSKLDQVLLLLFLKFLNPEQQVRN